MPNSPISEEMIRRIATLAGLELAPAESESFAREIGDVLFYFEKLKAVDVTGVEPLFQPFSEFENPLREDIIVPRLSTPVVDCAPSSLDGGFKVPQVI